MVLVLVVAIFVVRPTADWHDVAVDGTGVGKSGCSSPGLGPRDSSDNGSHCPSFGIFGEKPDGVGRKAQWRHLKRKSTPPVLIKNDPIELSNQTAISRYPHRRNQAKGMKLGEYVWQKART